MATRLSWVALLLAVCALLGVCWVGRNAAYVASAQKMGPPGAGNPGPGQPNPGMGGPPDMAGIYRASPSPAVTAADGIVYVAFMGTLTAYDAKTLRKLGEVKYWTHPGNA